MTGDVPAGGGDVGRTGTAVNADGEVAQAGHHGRSVSYPDLGEVFGEDDVADPVQAIFDTPVGAGDVGEFGSAELVLGEVGDHVDGFGVPASAAKWPALPGDLGCGLCVREADAGGDGSELDGAGLGPAVALAAGDIDRRDVAPGQRFELGVQAGLVGFDGEQVFSELDLELVCPDFVRLVVRPVVRCGSVSRACRARSG